MTDRFDDMDADLLLVLQRGLPLEPKPFARIGADLGLTEDQVMAKALSFMQRGLVRRFGAVFDARNLGYDSTLCAVDVQEKEVNRVVAALAPRRGITHCYLREGKPSLWFTVTAPADELAGEIETITAAVAPCKLLNLPASRIFKIGVILDVRHGEASKSAAANKPSGQSDPSVPKKALGQRERALVRVLQDNIPMSPDPFAKVAGELGFGHAELISLLNEWKRVGILRRVGLIPHHRELGFAVNGMCVWNVEGERVEGAGKILARSPVVTHCYERAMRPEFPFNLFAMIHAETHDEALELRSGLAAAAGLSGGKMLVSIKEFKKTSAQFFV